METVRLSGVFRALSHACDVAAARPYGFSQRVARAAMRLSAELPLTDHVRASLLQASLFHSAGMAAISGDVARIAFGDERPMLRLYPCDAIFNKLALGSSLDSDGEVRTGVFMRHHVVLSWFPGLTARWLERLGLQQASAIVGPMLDLAERGRLHGQVAVASGVLSLAYHMVAMRWVANSTSAIDSEMVEHARALLDTSAWMVNLQGVVFEPAMVELASELWLDEQFWSEMDAARTDAVIRTERVERVERERERLADVDLDAVLGSYTFSANELTGSVPDIEVAINELLVPSLGETLEVGSVQLDGWLQLLGWMVDHKSSFEPGHAQRLFNMTRELALLMGLDDAQARRAAHAAWLYGAGKLALPSALLEQGRGLSDAQRAMVREVPRVTRTTLAPMAGLSGLVEEASTWAERMDGSGYPEGLRAADIPPVGRLLAVVDTFEALQADRPYRPAYSRARALHILQAQSGRLFDGLITDLLEGLTRGEL